MSWKYVLVGVALILPGNLHSIEGRESETNGGAREDDSSVLQSLREYFKHRLSDDVPGQVHPGSPDSSLIEDVKNSETAILQDSKNPRFPTSHGHDLSESQEVPAIQEVGAEERQPLALAVRQPDQNGNHRTTSSAASTTSMMFIMIVSGCTVLAAIGIVGAGVCWFKYNKRVKSANVVDYPAYGVTGPTKDSLPSPGDRKLAQSAQMFHFQHQKQQMIAMEKANGSMKHDASDEESEEDNVEGDYTVYECPGLAPTGEMEVKNPLFRGDETPTTPVNEEDPPQPEDKK